MQAFKEPFEAGYVMGDADEAQCNAFRHAFPTIKYLMYFHMLQSVGYGSVMCYKSAPLTSIL